MRPVVYEPPPNPAIPVVAMALQEAAASADCPPSAATRAVLAFLEYMSREYVGDYYVEGSLAHLVTMVEEASA